MAQLSAIVAVLAGGAGERLGGDKAVTPLAGRPLVCHPLRAARETGLPVVVVAKPSTLLPPLEVAVLREPELPRHPLCGALAALGYASELYPPRAVVFVACDMPFLTAALLEWLAGLDGAVTLEVAERAQPLPARCMPVHSQALREALAARSSLRAALQRLAPQVLSERELSRFGDPRRLCFNVNGPDDLRRAERWLR